MSKGRCRPYRPLIQLLWRFYKDVGPNGPVQLELAQGQGRTMKSNPDRKKKIKELCDQALDLDSSERKAFLDQACAEDAALRREVESLLSHEKSVAGFLAQPAWQHVVREMAKGQRQSLEGRQLGHYQVHERLGQGGMGEVWRATDQRLKRDVAIKILPPAFSTDAERVRRFEREAYAVSALKHPNIITLHEIGQADDRNFIVP